MTLPTFLKPLGVLGACFVMGMAADAPAHPASVIASASVSLDLLNFLRDHVTGGSLGIMITLLGVYRHFRKAFGPAIRSFSLYREEHDILWEDYNIRNGGSWRRERGRGSRSALHDHQPSARTQADE